MTDDLYGTILDGLTEAANSQRGRAEAARRRGMTGDAGCNWSAAGDRHEDAARKYETARTTIQRKAT